MLPQGSSPFRRTMGALILSVSVAQSLHAQAPSTPGIPENLREDSPIVPESTIERAPMTSPTGGLSTTRPVLTPGYFEVVCPAICYGGAFRVCNIKAFAGPGYYGPFRRYWAYGTYGPSFNIGPDNSLQYGLIGGVMYEVQRACKGCYTHGINPCPGANTAPPASAQYTVMPPPSVGGGGAGSQPTAGPARGQPEKLPPANSDSAHLRIRVPQNAEVLVEGSKTATTGAVREFVSPPLEPGKNMIYSILVRYNDASGKKIEETHSIRVRANDQLDIDCTRPANVEPTRATVQRP